MENKSNKRRVSQCARCNLTFAAGWKFTMHLKKCTATPPPPHSQISDPAPGRSSPELWSSSEGEGDYPEPLEEGRSDLLEHQSFLSGKGTLDDRFLVSYLDVPRRGLSAAELEVCMFLSSLDSGTGVSMATVQGSLRYVRRAGGRALLLPKTARKCWGVIEKVANPPPPLPPLHLRKRL